jgi:hypothetical protein
LREVALGTALLLIGCAPDYSAVQSWARTASLGTGAAPGPAGGPAVPSGSVAAMQEALLAYLAAIASLSADGFARCENPCLGTLSAQAEAEDGDAALAITRLGAVLRRADANMHRAPELRETIRAADPALQLILAALSRRVGALAEASDRELVNAGPGQPPARSRADALRRYQSVLAQIGEGHAVLAARARRITQRDSIRQINAAEDSLRRAILALHPGLPSAALGHLE